LLDLTDHSLGQIYILTDWLIDSLTEGALPQYELTVRIWAHRQCCSPTDWPAAWHRSVEQNTPKRSV